MCGEIKLYRKSDMICQKSPRLVWGAGGEGPANY